MTVDLGEVLSRAWPITWKHKVLWFIGILFGFFVSIMFPLLLAPAFLPIVILSVSIVCMVIFIPLFAILSGWSVIFSKSARILTCLRLTRSSKLQPLRGEATS